MGGGGEGGGRCLQGLGGVWLGGGSCLARGCLPGGVCPGGEWGCLDRGMSG